MSNEPRETGIADLPDTIPVFPLHGVLLLPKGQLPLNIFEKQYLAMVEDVMRGARVIGMVQPADPGGSALYKTGCAGRVTSYQETEDGRILVTLTGLCRFVIREELETDTPYRQVAPDWSAFDHDLAPECCSNLDRDRLSELLRPYFEMHELTCSWEHIEKASDEKLITCLSMICPLEPGEKQALLEARNCADRGDKFLTMLEMAVKSTESCCSGKCH